MYTTLQLSINKAELPPIICIVKVKKIVPFIYKTKQVVCNITCNIP